MSGSAGGRHADDAALAAGLAAAAGRLLVALRAEHVARAPGGVLDRDAARALRDAGDAASQAHLAAALAAARPGDAVLSEEAADDPARLDADRVWVVDPLDGTREFGEPPRVDWAVHVALWTREADDLVAGAVALPAEGVVLASDPAPPAPPQPDRPPRLVVSRSRAPELVAALAERIGGELVPRGSAGAKAMAVVRGEVDAYVHGGGQYEWDGAAPVAVARAAGLSCSRLDGSPLRYNQPDPWSPELLVCRPDLADRVVAALADLRA